MSVVPLPGTISFARGVPPPDAFLVEELADCARAAIAGDGRNVLNYGSPAGHEGLREWVAARHGVAPDRVLLTPGSLVAVNLLARALLRPGDAVLVEAPTYDRILRILGGLGAALRAVPRTEEGLDPDALRTALGGAPRPAFFYTLPTFHNPTGRTLDGAGRLELLDEAAAAGVLVLEDDPYGLVRFEGTAPPTLLELALQRGIDDLVVHASSFSKTVAPGLRIGYAILPPALVPRLEQLVLDLYVSPPTAAQAQLAEYLRRGLFERGLTRVRELLRTRHDALLETLAAEAPASAAWTRPGGGYFLWLDLPPGTDARVLLEQARAAGVLFTPGADFYPGEGGRASARLAFSFPSPEEVREGARRLGRLLRES